MICRWWFVLCIAFAITIIITAIHRSGSRTFSFNEYLYVSVCRVASCRVVSCYGISPSNLNVLQLLSVIFDCHSGWFIYRFLCFPFFNDFPVSHRWCNFNDFISHKNRSSLSETFGTNRKNYFGQVKALRNYKWKVSNVFGRKKHILF